MSARVLGLREFRGDRSPLDLRGRTAVLVGDGLASGFTKLVTVEAVRRAGAAPMAEAYRP